MERRRFQRWEIQLPCKVRWKDYIITGQIINLSLGGALIDQVNAIPSVGAKVVVEFQDEKGKVSLACKANSTIVHSRWSEGAAGRFGVQFQEPTEVITSKLKGVLETIEEAAQVPGPKHSK